MTTELRRGNGNYVPTHGALYTGNGKTRSCGKCAAHKPIKEGEWKKWKAYGLVCTACRGEPK